MLIVLVNLDAQNKTISFYLLSPPDFEIDASRTTTLRLDQPFPEDAHISIRLEWLYAGKVPDWVGSTEEVIVDPQSVEQIYAYMRSILGLRG